MLSRLSALFASAAVALVASLAAAQAGDRKNEVQGEVPAEYLKLASPVVPPEEARSGLKVPEGYRVDLLASEPLIHDPVWVTFDVRMRPWVVEMRGFMPDADGTGELEPIGRIVVLEDDDKDGRYDRAVPFLEKLVLPRGVLPFEDGVLVIEPPSLWWCKDNDGDGRCDSRQRICDGFEAGLDNPEHAGNALLYGIDNWIYLANYGKRLRKRGDLFEIQDDLRRGQWGLTQDAYGRTYHNNNSNYLYVDAYPSWLAIGNEAHGTARGVNVRTDKDQSTWPSRINPGINRGYQKQMLREGKLARFTSTCGPEIYLGQLAELASGEGATPSRQGFEFFANAYVPEPAGNFVRKAWLFEDGRSILSRNALKESEWLTSQDERFRPVQCITGPDGGLWIVDLYRGILQHRRFMTTFLRTQVIARGLDKPLGLGRIYRVAPQGAELRMPQALANKTVDDLSGIFEALCSPNGALRILAQRFLVEQSGQADDLVIEFLRRIFAKPQGFDDKVRLHVFWTLHGLAALDPIDLSIAAEDPSRHVRASLATGLLTWPGSSEERDRNIDKWMPGLLRDADRNVRLRALSTLARLPGREAQVVAAIPRDAADLEFRSLTVACLAGREHKALAHLFATAPKLAPGMDKFARVLASAVAERQEPEAYKELLATLQSSEHPLGKSVRTVLDKKPLTAKSRPRISRALDLRGKQLFGTHCAACHQPSGRGLPGLAPSLRDAELLHGPVDRPIRIVLHGLEGKVKIAGKDYELVMPGHPHIADADIAAILSHLRNAWGHKAPEVSAKQVEELRKHHADRKNCWPRDALR
jgi:mono/diheme cytochrome c family protein